jgi:plastocyanin
MPRTLIPLVLALGLIAAACSSDSTEATTTSTTAATTTVATTEAPTTTGEVPLARTDVTISGLVFRPPDVTVPAGTTVNWVHIDSGVPHTVTSEDDVWNSASLGEGQSFEVVFDDPGVFAYHCSIHPSMTGTVTVEG